MPSLSCNNLLDLAEELPPRSVMADASPSLPASYQSPCCLPRRVIVSHRLPLRAAPDVSSPFGFSFTVDADSVSHQLRSGLPDSAPVLHVGTLPLGAASEAESEELAGYLLANFSCLPVFLPADLHRRFYHDFCKHYMWPLLHYLLPLTTSTFGGLLFDRALYSSFLSANMKFVERLTEVLNPEEDLVWIHDYHLLALPTLLRKRVPRAKVGFFLHSPFPSLEIFRTIPVREDLLRALLNADLVGFHTFHYARHFMDACSLLLGLEHHSKGGYIGIEYYGRTVRVKILPVGIDVAQLRSVVTAPETDDIVREVTEAYKGRRLMVGVDDADLFKGIGLKFLGMEQLLLKQPELRGRAVLVQIVNPARSEGRDIEAAEEEARAISARVNEQFGKPAGYTPIVMINRPLSVHEKAAYYAAAECCVVSAVRDGFNRIPYIYTVCRQESTALALAVAPNNRGSAVVLSEFVGCSPSLSGAIRVNPWCVQSVGEAMRAALTMPEVDQRLLHEKHYKYVSTHDVAYWAKSFDKDLQRACKDHFSWRPWGLGFGMSFKVVALAPDFCHLSLRHILPSFNRTENRLILLDYDGTVMPAEISSVVDDKRAPSTQVISLLNRLCEDPKTKVFIVSGRGKDELSDWFAPCEKLGIAAEHGYFTRSARDAPWDTRGLVGDFDWKQTAEPVMKLYMERTDGSCIEYKESALVWHYQEADSDIGSCQAKALLDHLETVLANEPVVVKRGQHIVEVKPQGVSKGVVVESLLSSMVRSQKPPDFVLCVGDDRSDEDMFESMVCAPRNSSVKLPATSEVFACTVGMKPSMAKYYLHDTVDVISLLQRLANAPSQQLPSPVVSFQVTL